MNLELKDPTSNGHDRLCRMTEVYVEWLNKWTDAQRDDFSYTPEDFLTAEHSSREVIVDQETGWYHLTVVRVDDGDEGGGSVLYGWWLAPRSPRPEDTSWELVNMAQEFDTSVQFILSDSKLINIPDDHHSKKV